VQDFRVDERARQETCRERHRQAGTAAARAPCHAVASAPNPRECEAKLLESWDGAMALSRATLQRQLAVILRPWQAPAETRAPPASPLSRASLEP
jgi:hypothetical protein